jgi:hypothetical protein
MAINENTLAKEIAAEEGGKENLSIAQVKEVLSRICKNFARRPFSEVAQLLEKHKAKLDAAEAADASGK